MTTKVLLDTWKKHITGACRAIYRKDRTEIKKRLDQAAWTHTDIPLGIPMDRLRGLWENWEKGERRELREKREERSGK